MERIPLGELGDVVSGSTPKTHVAEYWGGDIPWITPANLSNNRDTYFRGALRKITRRGFASCSTRMLPTGSILFSSRAPIGHCAITAYPLCTNQGFKSLIPNQRLDNVYGYYALRHATSAIVALGRGATFAEINKEMFEGVRIPVPPLDEQKRIAALLDKADHLRRSRRYAQELSDSFLQSAFLEMFGDPMTNPCGWATVELGDLVQAFEGGVNFNPVPENSPSSPWRVLKISSVTSGEFKPGESKAIAPDTTFNELLIVRKGDLLMSRANTTELVGAVCMVRHIPPRVLLPDKLWRMKLRRTAEVNANYLLHILQLPHIRRIIGELATGTSGSMKNISKDKAGTIPIMLPPHGQQEAFAEVVHRVERLRAQQHEAERQAEHLFQTLLHRAFAVESDVV